MKAWKKIFEASIRYLHSVRALTVGAVLIAIQVVLAMTVSLPLTDSLHITFDRCALALNASMLGPVMGMLSGAAADLLQCLLHGWAYNPGLSLNEVLTGCLYGLLLFGRPSPKTPGHHSLAEVGRSVWRLALCQTIVCVVINSLMGTLWLSLMYGWPYPAYLPARLIKNLIQLPVDIMIIWACLVLRDKLYAAGIVKPFDMK